MEYLNIYTDGSMHGNGTSEAVGGFGAHMIITGSELKHKQHLNKYVSTKFGYKLKTDYLPNSLEPLIGISNTLDIYGYDRELTTTNNQAELLAIIEALKAIPKFLLITKTNVKVINILTDSTYSKLVFEKVVEKRFNRVNVKSNLNFYYLLEEALLSLVNLNVKIVIKKVKAHDKCLGNNRADLLANMGTYRNKKSIESRALITKLFTGNTYWNKSKVNTDYWYMRHLFHFNNHVASMDNKLFYSTNYKKVNDMGKKLSNVTYTVSKFKELDELGVLLNQIKMEFVKRLNGVDKPFVLDITAIKAVIEEITKYGADAMRVVTTRDRVLLTAVKKESKPATDERDLKHIILAETIFPAGLSILADEKFLNIERDLTAYLDGSSRDTILELTNDYYELNKKKKLTLKPTIINDKFILPIKHNKSKFLIKHGLDLPPRNIMKRFEKLSPKINLLLKDREALVVYNTVCELDNNVVLYSSNLYGNKKIKK